MISFDSKQQQVDSSLRLIKIPTLSRFSKQIVYPKESKQLVMDVLRALDIDVFELKKFKVDENNLLLNKLSQMERDFLSHSVSNTRLVTEIINDVVTGILVDYGISKVDLNGKSALRYLNDEQDGKMQEIVRGEILKRLEDGIHNYIQLNSSKISDESREFLKKLKEKAQLINESELQKWVPIEHVIGYMIHALEQGFTNLNICISEDLGKDEKNFYVRQEIIKLFKGLNVGKSEGEVKENIKLYLNKNGLYEQNNEGKIKDKDIDNWFNIFNNENQKLLDKYETLLRVININNEFFNDTKSNGIIPAPHNIKPYDIEHDVKNQSPEPARSIVETTSNALDASVKGEKVDVVITKNSYIVQDYGLGMNPYVILEKLLVPRISGKDGTETVGRFGIGFYTVLNHLKEKGDSVKIETCFEDKKYTLEFKKHERSGKIFLTTKTEEKSFDERGTKIIVTTNDTKEEEFKNLVKDYFKYNFRNPIYLSYLNEEKELINPIPKNAIKLENGSLYFSNETINTENEYGSVSLLVNGVKIEDIRIHGLNVPKDVIIDFPITTKLLESRGTIVSNIDTEEFLKNLIITLKENKDISFLEKVKVLNAISEVVPILEERLENTLDFKLEEFLKIKIEDESLRFIPNDREFLPLDIDDKGIVINSKVVLVDIKNLDGVEEVKELSANKPILLCKFKDRSKLYYVTKGYIFLNKEVFDLLKENGNATVTNLILSNISKNIDLYISTWQDAQNIEIPKIKNNEGQKTEPKIEESVREYLSKYSRPNFTRWFEEYTKLIILGDVIIANNQTYRNIMKENPSIDLSSIKDNINNNNLKLKTNQYLINYVNALKTTIFDVRLYYESQRRFEFLEHYNDYFHDNFFNKFSKDELESYVLGSSWGEYMFQPYMLQPNPIHLLLNHNKYYLLSDFVEYSQNNGKFYNKGYLFSKSGEDVKLMQEVVCDYYKTLSDEQKRDFCRLLSCIEYRTWCEIDDYYAWLFTDTTFNLDEKFYETVIKPFDDKIDYDHDKEDDAYKQIYKNAITFFDKYFDKIKDKEKFFNDFNIARDRTGREVPEYLYPVYYFLLYGGELLENESSDPSVKKHVFNTSSQSEDYESLQQETTLVKLIATKKHNNTSLEYSKNLSSNIDKTTNSLDTSKYSREVENAIYFQNNSQAQILSEQCQNSRDAIKKSNAINNAIDITCIREDDDILTIECRDYVGMSQEDVLNYLLIPHESNKKDDKNLIGQFGQGFFSTLRGSNEVRIKTSIGDGNIFYVKISPITIDGKIVDYKINFDLVSDNEDTFKGTIIQKVIKSSFPEYDAALFKASALKIVEYIPKSEVDVRFNGETINRDMNEIVSLEYEGEKIKVLEAKKNVITQHGTYVCDVYDEVIKNVPKYLMNTKCDIEIPDSVELVMGRNDIASDDAKILRNFLHTNFNKILFFQYVKDALHGKQKLDLPSDLLKTYIPKHDVMLLEDAKKIENGNLDFNLNRYSNEQERIDLIFNIKDIVVTINGATSKYSVNELISLYNQRNLDINDENIKKAIPNWLLDAFKYKESMENEAKKNNLMISEMLESAFRESHNMSSIGISLFKDRGFPQYELFSELLNYMAKCVGYESYNSEIKFCLSDEAFLAHAYRDSKLIEFNLLYWDNELNNLINFINNLDINNIDKVKLHNVLAKFIETLTHEVVHTEEGSDDSTHDNTFRNHHNNVLLRLIKNDSFDPISFVLLLKEKYGDNIPQASFREFFKAVNSLDK